MFEGRRLGCLALTLASMAGVAACSTGDRFNTANSSFTPTMIRRFGDFPLYWVGTSFDGLPLTFIDGPDGPDHLVTFTYGSCTPTGTDPASCGSPLEIQIQPICTYLDVVASNPVWKHRRVRGARVGTIDHAPVLFASRVQVKVYSDSTRYGLRVMRALRSANRIAPVVRPREPIPAASDAELDRSQPCAPDPRAGS